jgi:indole-3-glycerol phosphate synthase
MYLEKILESKRLTVGELANGAAERQTRIRHARPPRNFAGALSRPGMSLIAEIKPRSPSCGAFGRAAEPLNLAIEYQASGASAVSVLADREFFGGGPELVERVANHRCIGIPILYKDFVIDPQQVLEARACGADAVLLIARAVEPELLRELV